ncbi:MAG: Dinucleotide-utilizing enzymes involved in molybdopterin and thiamine biosynthesis [Candidatus Tokpelaia sp. JSC161]|jgi:molybdopterin/thiamine biosynthesis adenylyltransferase|nr:MAG: Dinucleotide-utilizing enzymes involved in molybdopterin and thiamine biosynthesis [Candidatus Tokpelaia sp. JSC161]
MKNRDKIKLTPEEIERYTPHILLNEIGGLGQKKIKNAKVAVVGAGGLGAPILSYLAAAGIGTLGIVDNDIVSLSNLQRQIIHTTDKIGIQKTDSAEQAIKNINPHVKVHKHMLQLNPSNTDILSSYDIIIDGSDNFTTRYLLADFSEKIKKPLVSGAVSRFNGLITVLKPYENQNPRYRDLFPIPPPTHTMLSCSESGIISALPGVIGSLQAMETIKIITGIGTNLVGRILLYDGLQVRFETITYKKNKRYHYS